MFRFFCTSADQKERVLRFNRFDKFDVLCVSLWNRAPLKMVISDITLKVDVEEMKNIPGVIDAHRINPVVNGEKVNSLSVILFFDKKSLPTQV